MTIIQQSSENEMILAFLSAEIKSERFNNDLQSALKKLNLSENIIINPDLTDEKQNLERKKILGEYRGYGYHKEMFENFPEQIEWKKCVFNQNDLPNIRYIDYDYWNELSRGTKSPLTAAEEIRKNHIVYDVPNDGFIKAAEFLKKGGKLPQMIFLTSDSKHFVIVEGHQRMTAYAMVPNAFVNIEVFVGFTTKNELDKWM